MHRRARPVRAAGAAGAARAAGTGAGLAVVAAVLTGCVATRGPAPARPTAGSPRSAALRTAAPAGTQSRQAARPHAAFFGLDTPDTRTDVLGRELGVQPSVVSLFVKLDTGLTADRLRRLGPGITPFVTLEPWHSGSRRFQVRQPEYALRTVAAGRHDAALRGIARAIAAYGRPVYLRFAHEMNARWYPWGAGVNGNTWSDYRRAWQHVHALFAAEGARQVRWVWAPNTLRGTPGSPPLDRLYPGDRYVDLVGMTAYSRGDRTPATTFAGMLAALRAVTDRPVVLAETGAAGRGRSAWLAGLGTFVRSRPAIVGLVYFDTSPASTGATGNYTIDGDRSALQALRSSLRVLTRP